MEVQRKIQNSTACKPKRENRSKELEPPHDIIVTIKSQIIFRRREESEVSKINMMAHAIHRPANTMAYSLKVYMPKMKIMPKKWQDRHNCQG